MSNDVANRTTNRIGFSDRLKKLIEANQSLTKLESLDALLPRLIELARAVTHAEAASLMLYNPERDVLEFRSSQDEVLGEKANEILKTSFELKMGEGIAGWVAMHRESVNIPDVRQDPRFYSKIDKDTGFVTRNLLCVPVLHNKELLGVIQVLNSKMRPVFESDDEAILENFANLASVAIIRSRLLETRLKQQKLDIQMEMASKIQSLFWPKMPPSESGSHIWAVSLPAGLVGGDLYDAIRLPDGQWLVYVADVSGKGIPAALVMSSLWSRIRSEARRQEEVQKLLTAVNHAMVYLLSEENFFATILLAKYQPSSGRVQMANGGHLPPFLLNADGYTDVTLPRGLPLGIMSDAAFENTEMYLKPGDSLVLMTDGVTEACNAAEDLFGQARLESFFANTDGPPWGQGLVEHMRNWCGQAEAADDLTVMEIWREPA